MLTYDMPQRDDIVIAWGRLTVWCRLLTASAVEIWMKQSDGVPTDKMERGWLRAFALIPLDRLNAMGTGRANAIQDRGIGQGCLVMLIMLRGDDRWLRKLRKVLFRHGIQSMPVYDYGKTNGTESRQEPYKTALSYHSTCKVTVFCRYEHKSVIRKKLLQYVSTMIINQFIGQEQNITRMGCSIMLPPILLITSYVY